MKKTVERSMTKANSGSFRDPSSRVYTIDLPENGSSAIFRGVDNKTLENFKKLQTEPFYQQLEIEKRVVKTKLCCVSQK